jgi:hypothetical protein
MKIDSSVQLSANYDEHHGPLSEFHNYIIFSSKFQSDEKIMYLIY